MEKWRHLKMKPKDLFGNTSSTTYFSVIFGKITKP
jgi:hypothetical protein